MLIITAIDSGAGGEVVSLLIITAIDCWGEGRLLVC